MQFLILFLAIFIPILFISFVIFTLLFGESNSFKNTFIANFYTFLTTTIPSFSERIFGNRLCEYAISICSFLETSKHPVVQIFYLSIMTGCIIIFMTIGYPLLLDSKRINSLSDAHHFIIPLLIVNMYRSFYNACYSDPGKLTKENVHVALKVFEYDYILFKSGNTCKTCDILKPARSKHCSICKMCVAKNDHHWYFVFNTVFGLIIVSDTIIITCFYISCFLQ